MRQELIQVIEAQLDWKRAEPGQVKFKTSTLGDPHIRALVNDASKKTGIPAADIDAEIQSEVDDINEMKKYSPILYETAAMNAVENAAFDLIEHTTKSTIQFSIQIFLKLCKLIQYEHEAFFPIRAPGEKNYIFHITPIIVPTTKDNLKKYNSIPTACATAGGDFVFNKDFMQKLLNWASIVNLKPQGGKYECNGGDIPDQYGYIEFLIMHELLHYSYGDMTRMKDLKQYSPNTHNQAMDFRINYLLVKSGYNQLPIGLFSDKVNYDRQGSYIEMVKLVHEELKKLPKPLQDLFQQIADAMDDHSQSGNPSPGSSAAEQGQGDGDGDGDGDEDGKGSRGVKVGDKVRCPDGSVGRVTAVNPDGTAEVDPE